MNQQGVNEKEDGGEGEKRLEEMEDWKKQDGKKETEEKIKSNCGSKARGGKKKMDKE